MGSLKKSEIWWNGPKIILEGKWDRWAPKTKAFSSLAQAELKELQRSSLAGSTGVPQQEVSPCFTSIKSSEGWNLNLSVGDRAHPSHFSDFFHFIRVIARIKGMIRSFKHWQSDKGKGRWLEQRIRIRERKMTVSYDGKRVTIRQKTYRPPLEKALPAIDQENYLQCYKAVLRFVQWEGFRDEITQLQKSQRVKQEHYLSPYSPCLDRDGILRIDGRASKCKNVRFGLRCPVILPPNYVPTMVMQGLHYRSKHMVGYSWLFTAFSEEFWVRGGRNIARRVCQKCGRCRRLAARVTTPRMSPIPAFRLGTNPRPIPFEITAMDATAPIWVKLHSGAKAKRWLLIFTCVVFCAVYVKILHSTSTDSVLLAVERLCARQTSTRRIICDRAPGFKGAQNALAEILESIDAEKLQARLPEVELDFGPGSAPHFQGVVEIKVKAAKRALAAIMTRGRLSDEGLATTAAVVERSLNEMPISAVRLSSDPTALKPIRPADFVGNGRYQRMTLPVEQVRNLSKRWFLVNQYLDEWWKVLQKQLVQENQARTKWAQDRVELTEGDVVCVLDSKNKRGLWPVGRIVQVKKGVDGRGRQATVRIGTKEFQRAAHHLIPLLQ